MCDEHDRFIEEMQKRQMARERDVIVGLTSTAVRVLALCLREGRIDLIDQARAKLWSVADGLIWFGSTAGCDTGVEYTIIAIKQFVLWMGARDEAAARAALDDRYQTPIDAFYRSMKRAQTEVAEAERKGAF